MNYPKIDCHCVIVISEFSSRNVKLKNQIATINIINSVVKIYEYRCLNMNHASRNNVFDIIVPCSHSNADIKEPEFHFICKELDTNYFLQLELMNKR